MDISKLLISACAKKTYFHPRQQGLFVEPQITLLQRYALFSGIFIDATYCSCQHVCFQQSSDSQASDSQASCLFTLSKKFNTTSHLLLFFSINGSKISIHRLLLSAIYLYRLILIVMSRILLFEAAFIKTLP